MSVQAVPAAPQLAATQATPPVVKEPPKVEAAASVAQAPQAAPVATATTPASAAPTAPEVGKKLDTVA